MRIGQLGNKAKVEIRLFSPLISGLVEPSWLQIEISDAYQRAKQ